MGEVQDTARKQNKQSILRTGSENARAERKMGDARRVPLPNLRILCLGSAFLLLDWKDSDEIATRSRDKVT